MVTESNFLISIYRKENMTYKREKSKSYILYEWPRKIFMGPCQNWQDHYSNSRKIKEKSGIAFELSIDYSMISIKSSDMVNLLIFDSNGNHLRKRKVFDDLSVYIHITHGSWLMVKSKDYIISFFLICSLHITSYMVK